MENFKIKKEFFTRTDTHKIAKELLGKVLVRKNTSERIQAGIIVEVESYHGLEDRASHAAKARTKRTEVMFGAGGHYYTYLIYGMYWNLNIVVGEKEFPSAILIRALEPIYDSELNLNLMSDKEKFKLASGPGKLCRWMRIGREFYGRSTEDEELFLIDIKKLPLLFEWNWKSEIEKSNIQKVLDYVALHSNNNFQIIETKRIGVDYAGESALWDWRYYINNNQFVSKI